MATSISGLPNYPRLYMTHGQDWHLKEYAYSTWNKSRKH